MATYLVLFEVLLTLAVRCTQLLRAEKLVTQATIKAAHCLQKLLAYCHIRVVTQRMAVYVCAKTA